ncbi:DUF1905 domain-containing protein [Deinococcus budaensis]|uniref:DUF1905 domain-containing protein n=1 Tax=Deinococcus budaensis TaxID=1665626 RepID=A0A7W8GF66_9DEIO|nr:DUF1905 domain-containing protein [Deinococcus budaensis]MBB5234519.1 hypothetical protein [Deinococcus budaensis]
MEFSGPLWFWRGPAPWYFVTVPAQHGGSLKAASGLVTYGWGMIPVRARVGRTEWKTSLFPKEGLYVLPVRASVRQAEGIGEGDLVTVRMEIGK